MTGEKGEEEDVLPIPAMERTVTLERVIYRYGDGSPKLQTGPPGEFPDCVMDGRTMSDSVKITWALKAVQLEPKVI